MKKVVTIVGARPQFVKAATISRQLSNYDSVNEIIIHTGQHFDFNMSDIFFRDLQIPLPTYNLNIGGGTHGQNTGRMIEAIEAILIKEEPDFVLLYGDTDSTLAGAIATKKLHIKLVHIEAGLRSFNLRMPEEQNRIVTDRLSDILFCPTETAVNNLSNEGYSNLAVDIVNSGDVMYDSALFCKELNKSHNQNRNSENFILCTIHRSENTNDRKRLSSIINGLKIISNEIQIILPLHPRTKKVIESWGLDFSNSNIKILEPIGYIGMIGLLDQCEMVITDSGGLQKEAFFFSKPCITLRDETEWVELVEAGVNILVSADIERILSAYKLFKNGIDFIDIPFYGNGKAAEIICQKLFGF